MPTNSKFIHTTNLYKTEEKNNKYYSIRQINNIVEIDEGREFHSIIKTNKDCFSVEAATEFRLSKETEKLKKGYITQDLINIINIDSINQEDLKVDKDFDDCYTTLKEIKISIPNVDQDPHIITSILSDEFQDLQKNISILNNLSTANITEILKLTYEYYQSYDDSMSFKDLKEMDLLPVDNYNPLIVWQKHVTLNHISSDEDGIFLEGECTWDDEHGISIQLKQINSIIKVEKVDNIG